MKSARSFVRKVRSKSPFRRRKRAENLVADVRQKEQAYMKQFSAPSDPSGQPDDIAEIEVVLESTSSEFAASKSRSPSNKSRKDEKSPRKGDIIPDLAASSSLSTEEPSTPLSSAQAAARRFMERQQRVAAGNRRKSFKERFMRKKPSQTPPEPPSPARSTKQLGISKKGSHETESSSSSAQEQPSPLVQRRGRSRERSMRGSTSKGYTSVGSKSKSSHSSSKKRAAGPQVKSARKEPALAGKSLYQFESSMAVVPAVQPVTIEVGTHSDVSALSSPAAIIRQESLGNESIRGVRQALQKMEMELAAAGDSGKRVPRDKIMNALNFMADALHRDDQKEALVKELDAWIDESVIGGRVEDDDDDESDDETSCSDDGSSTFDLDAFDDSRSDSSREIEKQGSFQDLFGRLGKFFSISDEDKTAVRHALDDLLWIENTSNKPGTRASRPKKLLGDSDESDEEDSIGDFDPLTCNLHDPNTEPAANIAAEVTRGRSWWRRNGMDGIEGLVKKENLYPPRIERAPSVESKLSLPSPTGKVNPRSSKPHSSKSISSRSSGSKSSSKSRILKKPKKPATRMEPAPTPVPPSTFRLEDSETSVGWSDLDDSAFMSVDDRYSIPNNAKASVQHTKFANPHYKLTYTQSRQRQEFDRHFETEFLASPKEDDEWEDQCLHPAENLSHPRQAV